MTAQLDLFAWAAPPAPVRPARPAGFHVWHPCACGSTHRMTFIGQPYCTLSLRHWRLSRISAATAAMMAERHAAHNAAAQWGGHALSEGA